MITSSIVLILACLGLAQAVFLSLYLLTLQKGNRRSHIFLAFIILGITIRIGKSVLSNYIDLEGWQRSIGISGIFVAGPFLWYYGKILLEKNTVFSKWNYIHLLPFIFFILFITVIPSKGEFENFWNYGLVVFHLSIYLCLSWRLIYKNVHEVHPRVLHWYRNIVFGVTFIGVYYLCNFFNIIPYYISGPIFYTFLIYSFTYLFLKRHVFVLEKYGSSQLDKKASEDLNHKIKKLFIEEKLYLSADTSLSTVADKLLMSPRDVSQVINEMEQKNFKEFVNHYRVEYAKTLMMDSKYDLEKMSAIAYDSGFGNITSFNLAFKKETGVTPSIFKKQFTFK